MHEPAFRHVPTGDLTSGDLVAKLLRDGRFAPDPEQRMILDTLFSETMMPADDGASFATATAFETAIFAPRQNLKTAVIRMAEIGWLFLTEEELVIHSAHEVPTSTEAFRDLVELVESNPLWRKRMHKGPSRGIKNQPGREVLELASGQRFSCRARSKSGGRGLTGSKVVLDEALFLQPGHLGSLIPTMSTRPLGQVVYGSSAGIPSSAVQRRIRDRGRGLHGDPGRLAYFEWISERPCADKECRHVVGTPGCAFDDPESWIEANPAMGRRIGGPNSMAASIAYVRAERASISVQEFSRERLGRWEEPSGDAAINPAEWRACMDGESRLADSSQRHFVVQVAPNRSWAAIGVAGIREDGLLHAEITGNGEELDYASGTDWLLPRVEELADRWDARFHVLGGSAAKALLPDMKRLGVNVEEISSTDLPMACGQLDDLVAARRVRHIGQTALSDALDLTSWRFVGDRARVFSQRDPDGDITPVYAIALALWAANSSPTTEPWGIYS